MGINTRFATRFCKFLFLIMIFLIILYEEVKEESKTEALTMARIFRSFRYSFLSIYLAFPIIIFLARFNFSRWISFLLSYLFLGKLKILKMFTVVFGYYLYS